MRVFVTIETVYVVEVSDMLEPRAAELLVENEWDEVYRDKAQRAPYEDRWMHAQAHPTTLERNRAICGFCQQLQKTNPGEWCIAHQESNQ